MGDNMMNFKRILSLLLIVTFLMSMLPPTAVNATEIETTEEPIASAPDVTDSTESIPLESTVEETEDNSSVPMEEDPAAPTEMLTEPATSAIFSLKSVIEPASDEILRAYSEAEYEFWTSEAIHASEVVIPNYVTTIPDNAFSGCTNLISVTIPATVTYISQNAFSGCATSPTIRYGGTKLQWLKACCSDLDAICSDGNSDSVRAYGTCDTDDVRWVLTNKNVLYICGQGEMDTGREDRGEHWWEDTVPWRKYRNYIGKVFIDEGITDIGGYAFYQCPNLSEITIPSTISQIHVHAFLSANSLAKVYIHDLANWCTIDYGESWNSSPTRSGADLYLNGTIVTDLVIPSGVASVKQSFHGCKSLTSVVIPEGVTEISDNAFYWCSSLTKVSLPSSLKNIGNHAFHGCNFKSLTLPEGLVSIGEAAFYSNYDLPEITIPRSVEVISYDAFCDCSNLKTITFRHGPSDNLLIGGNSFYTWNKRATSIKVPVKSQTHEAISGYDWAGSNRSVTYYSHNCMNSHYQEVDGGTPATCTKSGTAGRVYCGACGKTISENTVIPALGHDEVTDTGFAATCTAAGLTDGRHCQRCGTTLSIQKTIAALGHNPVTHPAVAATCTQAGLTEGRECSRCDTVLTAQQTVPALGHDPVTIPAVAATCTKTGLTEGEGCSRCSHVSVTQQTVAKLPHTPVQAEAVAPTCTKPGLTAGEICSVCEAVTSGRKTVPALGHTEVAVGERIDPTCSATGLTEGKKCSVCGTTLEVQKEIEKLPHDYDKDDKCTVCGAIDALAYGACGDAVTWRLKKDGTLILSGTGNMQNYSYSDNVAPWSGLSSIKHVVIEPGVTSIGNYAFYYCQYLEDIELPDGLTSIGSHAFYYCLNLSSVTIPASVTEIGERAFVHGSKLRIWVEEANPVYSSDADGILYDKSMTTLVQAPGSLAGSYTIADSVTTIGNHAFYGCSKLTDVVIPDSVTAIEKLAFTECKNLVSVLIGNGVIRIGDSAFTRCQKLTEITISDSITSIGNYAFSSCTSLTSITLPDSLTSLGEFAFRECSGLTNVTLSNSITSIGQFTFYGCTNLSDVVIPDSVTSIGGYAFDSCVGLTDIVIPRNVTRIGDFAFGDCANLTKVIFLGAMPKFGGDHVFNLHYPVITYPAGAYWPYHPHFFGVTWAPVWASGVRLLDAEGNDVSGTTARICLNLDAQPLRIQTAVKPLGAYGECTWEWSKDLASVTENADGSITVTPTGKAGTMTLKAISKENSKLTARMTIQFLNVETQKEKIPGEDPADMNLLSGKSKQLNIFNTDTGTALTSKEVTWSMDEAYAPYAKIDAKGKITAKKAVEKIRVEAIGTIIGSEGTTVTTTVDIFPAVSHLTLSDGLKEVNNKTLTIGTGAEPLSLTADIYPLDAMGGVTWTVSDKKEAFATYGIEGNRLKITPMAEAKPGTVTIKATSTDGSNRSAMVKLQFAVYAGTVTIDKSLTTMTAGDKAVQLTATMTPSVVTKAGIIWSLKNADDKNYVTLSSSGKITPKAVLAPAEVTIVATSKDGMAKDSHTIRILPKSQKQLVIKSGDTYVTKTTQVLDVNTQQSITLGAFTYGETKMTAVEWSYPSNKAADIAKNTDGTLTVRMCDTGSIKITAKTTTGKAEVTIKGVKLAQSLTISQKKTNESRNGILEVASGKSLDLQAILQGAASQKVVWSIDANEDHKVYASVNASGKVTANKDLTSGGKVVVRATAADGSGATDTLEILVRPLAQGVQVYSEAGGQMLFNFRTQNWWVRSNTTVIWDLSAQEDTVDLDAHVFPYYGGKDAGKNAIQAVTWKSSSPKIADFVKDADGNVRLKIYKTGSTTITVTANDGSGQKVTFKLNTVKTVTSLSITNQTIQSGKSLNLAKLITINPTDATNKKLTWSITKGSAYATVSTSGSFKAKKVTVAKTVEVTVKSQDGGASAKFSVTITP